MKKLFSKAISSLLVLMFIVSLLPGAAFAADSGSKAGKITASTSLNVRSSASAGSTILTTLPSGSYVTLISKSGSWWKVEYGTNKYGYCSAGYITAVSGSYAAYATTALNVRSGPSTSNGIISLLSKGQYAVVLSSSGTWKKVLFGGTRIGYVSGSYLSTGSSGSGNTGSTGYSPVSLSIPSYKQTDSRWAYTEVGTSGKTINSIGCSTTALAMTESYRTGTTITPNDMEARLKYTASGSVYWPSNYTSYTSGDYISVVYNLLKSGKPVLIGLTNNYGGQHWVVITGFTGGSSLSWSSFTVNDPATSSRTTLAQVVDAYPNFYKLMHY